MKKEMDKVRDLVKISLDKIDDEKIRKLIDNKVITGGKQLRPFFYLAFKRLLSGKIKKVDLEIAAGIELLHYASLIHDDIIDESVLRRKISTLNVKEGNHQAVIIGDIMFSLALDLFSGSKKDIIKILSRRLKDLSIGQALSYANRFNYEISEKEYFNIIRLKTSSLFILCFELACFGNKEKGLVSLGDIFGEYYQLKDDLKDFMGVDKNSSDLKIGEITLPLIYLKKILPDNKFQYLVKNDKFIEISALIHQKGVAKKIDSLINIRKNMCIDIIKKISSPRKKTLLDMLRKI